MRVKNAYAKSFFYIMSFAVIMLLYLSVKDLKNTQEALQDSVKLLEVQQKYEKLQSELVNKSKSEMKYILQWTSSRNVPFVYMGVGQQGFIDRNCPYTNCIVTGDKLYFGGDITKFDVIAFSGPQVVHMNKHDLPKNRSLHQKYVFASIESPDYYPVCSQKFDDFFNWTWTYKLDSEAKWGYMVIKDAEGNVIGPKREMTWLKLEEMDSVSEELKENLKTKSKAAAWFVSNCYSRSGREKFVKDLQAALKQFKLEVDIYGSCGPLKCPRGDHEDKCYGLIEKDYYFYLSFENSMAEDYVTEKLLNALKHNAVPIVFGAADYSRFMPDGIYLDARKLGVKALAEKMNELIQDFDKYTEFFRWKNHYSYHRQSETPETDEYCRFCSILNEEELVKKTSIYHNFREWWDPPNRC